MLCILIVSLSTKLVCDTSFHSQFIGNKDHNNDCYSVQRAGEKEGQGSQRLEGRYGGHG